MAGDYRCHIVNGGVYRVDKGVHSDAAITYAETHALYSSLISKAVPGQLPLQIWLLQLRTTYIILSLVSHSHTIIFCFILSQETQHKQGKNNGGLVMRDSVPRGLGCRVIVGDTRVDSTCIFTLYATGCNSTLPFCAPASHQCSDYKRL